jgi:hypothetical protein
VLSRAQVGCACSRGLQASAWEGARGLHAPSRPPRAANLLVREPLEDKFYGLELNHVARRYNETADELAKIASGRTTVPPDIFSRDLHQPSVKTDDTPEPE